MLSLPAPTQATLEGAALRPGTAFFWRVRVWGEELGAARSTSGSRGAWSSTQTFCTAGGFANTTFPVWVDGARYAFFRATYPVAAAGDVAHVGLSITAATTDRLLGTCAPSAAVQSAPSA